MKTKLFLLLCSVGAPLCLHAADIPVRPIAKKGALLFSDDFSAPEVGKAWRITHPTFVIADGVLKASQTKDDHAAGARVLAGRKDLVIEFKFRLEGSEHVNAVCNDSAYKEGHAGHMVKGAAEKVWWLNSFPFRPSDSGEMKKG
jgi:hypothetical protein